MFRSTVACVIASTASLLAGSPAPSAEPAVPSADAVKAAVARALPLLKKADKS